MRRSLATLVALAVLAACSGGSSGATAAPAPVAELSGSLTVQSDAGAAGPFKLDGLTGLAVDARVRGGPPGPRSYRVDVIAPSGLLYTQLRASGDPGAGEAVLSRALRVRGTVIDLYRYTGTWHFLLAVDDGPTLADAAVDLIE